MIKTWWKQLTCVHLLTTIREDIDSAEYKCIYCKKIIKTRHG